MRVRAMNPVDQLSALEEYTFRRIANSGAKANLLRGQDLRRLVDLGLARIKANRVTLTKMGRARFAALERGSDAK